MAAAIIDALGAFLAPLSPLERLFSTPVNALDFDALISGRQILIANLSTALLGEAPARLLAGLLSGAISQAARVRGERPAEKPARLHLYLPQFRADAAGALEPILADLTTVGVSVTIAHQKLDQISTDLQRAIFDTVGTVIAFQIDADDAAQLTREMSTRRRARASTGALYDPDAERRAAAAPVRAHVRDLLAAARVFPEAQEPAYEGDSIARLLADIDRVRTLPIPEDLIDIDWPSPINFTELPSGAALLRSERPSTVTALTLDAPLPTDSAMRTKILERPQRRDAPVRPVLEAHASNGNRPSRNGDRPPHPQRPRQSRLRQRPRR